MTSLAMEKVTGLKKEYEHQSEMSHIRTVLLVVYSMEETEESSMNGE